MNGKIYPALLLTAAFMLSCGGGGGSADTNTTAVIEPFGLYHALMNMNTNRVWELMTNGYDVNEAYVTNLILTNKDGSLTNVIIRTPPIEVAVMKWDVDMVSNLMVHGALPFDSLLITAVDRTNLALSKFLLKTVKLKAEIIDPETGILTTRWAPLHIAAMYGMKDIAALLADSGANLDITDPSNEMTPLHLACSNGQYDIVKILIKKGALINPADKNGATPLSYTTNMVISNYMISKGGFNPELPE